MDLVSSAITLPDPECSLFLTKTLDRTALEQLLPHFISRPDPDDFHVLVMGEEPPDPDCLATLDRQGLAHVFHGRRLDLLLMQISQRRRRNAEITALLSTPLVCEHLPGESRAWRQTLREAIRAARDGSGMPVLLLGDTGTGKEMLARLLHTLDTRPKRGELITVDCTTLTPELAGSELFGHERGAFTGAVGTRRGVTAAADGGTLFLDEVGELGLDVQAKLLRVLQEGTFKPVGSNQWQRVSFRLVCATHRCLQDDVKAGRFRADLYYRIASTVVQLPRLSEREHDVLLLARHFLREFGASGQIDPLVEHLLLRHPFEGNVRELRHLMQQAVVVTGTGEDTPLTLDALPNWWRKGLPAPAAPVDPPADTALVERAIRDWIDHGLDYRGIRHRTRDIAMRVALADESQNVCNAARRLRVTPRYIHKWREQQLAALPAPPAPPEPHA